jgi:hypothetical protein
MFIGPKETARARQVLRVGEEDQGRRPCLRRAPDSTRPRALAPGVAAGEGGGGREAGKTPTERGSPTQNPAVSTVCFHEFSFKLCNI